jgi:hypothetical protein
MTIPKFDMPALSILSAPSGALPSADGKYIYATFSKWDNAGALVHFVDLSPAKMRVGEDTKLAQKLSRVSQQLGFGGFVLTFAYAYNEALSGGELRKAAMCGVDVIGMETDRTIEHFAKYAEYTTNGWGPQIDQVIPGRNAHLLGLLNAIGKPIQAIAVDDGFPRRIYGALEHTFTGNTLN